MEGGREGGKLKRGSEAGRKENTERSSKLGFRFLLMKRGKDAARGGQRRKRRRGARLKGGREAGTSMES